MGRPLRVQYPGAVYHITSRGNERRAIFHESRDRLSFLDTLKEYHDRFDIVIHSYVLMDNHYHLILETPKGNLLKVMHGINSRYTGYFNRKYNRSGHLFQGRYAAIIVDKDVYLVELSRYIHLNPVKAGMVEKPEEYRWSSYRGYMGKGKTDGWVEYAWVLNQFGKDRRRSQQKYKEYTEKELGENQESPFSKLWGQVILGGEEFQQKIKNMLKGKPIGGEIVERKAIESTTTPSAIIKAVAGAFGVAEEEVTMKGRRENRARLAALHLVQRYSGLGNEAIGKIFGGVHYSTVTKASARLQERMENDTRLKKLVQEVISYIKT